MKNCTWSEDSDGTWNSSCGNLFQFECGSPANNGFRFCPFCGETLLESPLEEDETE
jgi:hypothetical protein